MTYELAKQLKDAGFIFPKKDGCPNCWGDLHRGCDEDCGKEHDPTLPELIEACGDRFITLTNDRGEQNKFWAEGHIGEIGSFVMPEECIETSGSTPEEAVARLWIELNKTNPS